jgi:3-hydroxyacyl-CoA dehydrogenase/3-hydroxy-2-methylbutyryl-CoA dehydrogenase
MTLPMARDLGRHGIRVNTIAPSAFASPMTDRMSPKVKGGLSREMMFPKRFGQSVEFAQTVKWMIETPYVNGETYRLSGASRMPARM